MRMGSASQLELAAAADVGTGSEAILAWSDLLDFFGSWCICDFLSGSAFTSCSGLWSLMHGANMSIVGRAVVKRLPTRTRSECVLCDSLVVGFQVMIESRFV